MRSGPAVGRRRGRAVPAAHHPPARPAQAVQPQRRARTRPVMRICPKREDWGLFDYPDAKHLNARIRRGPPAVRRGAARPTTPRRPPGWPTRPWSAGVTLGERMTLFHADILPQPPQQPPWPSAARVRLHGRPVRQHRGIPSRLRDAFDFIRVPLPWKHTEPKERALPVRAGGRVGQLGRQDCAADPRRAAAELRAGPPAGMAVHLGARLRGPARPDLRAHPADRPALREARQGLECRLRHPRPTTASTSTSSSSWS